jgi:hypothetical protein
MRLENGKLGRDKTILLKDHGITQALRGLQMLRLWPSLVGE